MNISLKNTSDTEAELTFVAGVSDLQPVVKEIYETLRPRVKAAGFRPGKAPNNIIERELGPQTVQTEVVEAAIGRFYRQALEEKALRPLDSPAVTIKKFVPYSELEFTAVTEVLPNIKLADYKKITKKAEVAKVTEAEIDQVVSSLRNRLAKRKEVSRAAKNGDEAVIDFDGKQNGKEVPNTSAKNQPLLLGSKRFIPGFEENLIGMKPSQTKSFEVKFPKDYGQQSMANQTVTFTVTLQKLFELNLPELNDAFANEAGPFKDLQQLRADVAKQISTEKDTQVQKALETEVINEVVETSQMALPPKMLERELQHLQGDFERQLIQSGKTLEQYLEEKGQKPLDLEKELQPQAERRVKTALVLTEVAREEKLELLPEEFEMRLQLLKGQYQDKTMQLEMDKPEVRREIANQILAEKTVAKLVSYATQDKQPVRQAQGKNAKSNRRV